jgi:hypothetical protein
MGSVRRGPCVRHNCPGWVSFDGRGRDGSDAQNDDELARCPVCGLVHVRNRATGSVSALSARHAVRDGGYYLR